MKGYLWKAREMAIHRVCAMNGNVYAALGGSTSEMAVL